MKYQKVLVTGASGKSGLSAVKALIANGITPRAMVRKEDERAQNLRKLGAEVVIGDFQDLSSLQAALQDIEAAIFIYPVAEGIVEAAGLFSEVAQVAKLQRLIHLSVGGADPYNPSPHLRAQWVAEKVFEWAGLPVTQVRLKVFFLENTFLHAREVATNKTISNSFGDLKFGWLTGEEAGKVAISVLLADRFEHEQVICVASEAISSFPDFAEILSELLGTKVTYHEISTKEYKVFLTKLADLGRITYRVVDHLTSQSSNLKKEVYNSNTIPYKEVVGENPASVRAFFEKKLDNFRG